MRRILLNLIFVAIATVSVAKNNNYDVVIIGGGASGVTAGLQSARLGSKTLIVEESTWLGGMLTSAGVSAVDGNYRMPSGLWGEFKDALTNYYGGKPENLMTGWVSNVLFEPSVGNIIFKEMVAKESNLSVRYSTTLAEISKDNKGWKLELRNLENGKKEKVNARIVIDATELGDVAKAVGVGYDIGMESRSVTKEDIAPLESNNIVQDLTYVAILKDYGHDVTIAQPEGYNPADFACTCINDLCQNPKEPKRMRTREEMITYGKLPNGKYMINWPIVGNDYYLNLIDMTPVQREEALKKAKNYTMCYVYFMQHELGFKNLGLADDEFPTKDKLPFIPYHRESRRIHGEVRFTLNDVTAMYDQQTALYRTSIAVGDYPVDHHHMRYEGAENLPNLYFHPIPSYGLPLGTLIPKDVDNFIVAEKSISVSNIINGTTRLQPVVLQIGQAAGALASLSLQQGKKIKDVEVRDVQNVLLSAGTYLLPYLDVAKSDPMFLPLQRIGASGVLRGMGKNVDWSNQTWMRINDNLLGDELEGMKQLYPSMSYVVSPIHEAVKLREAISIIKTAAKSEGIDVNDSQITNVWNKFNLGAFNTEDAIKRGAFAVLADQILDPFNKKPINLYGKIK